MAGKGPLLVTDELTKVFDRARAVDNVSLDIPAGQFVGVIGRSGAGKSTLLRLINRLTDPSAGRVLCGGIEVTVLRGRRLRVWRRRCASAIVNIASLPPTSAKTRTASATFRPRSAVLFRWRASKGEISVEMS